MEQSCGVVQSALEGKETTVNGWTEDLWGSLDKEVTYLSALGPLERLGVSVVIRLGFVAHQRDEVVCVVIRLTHLVLEPVD